GTVDWQQLTRIVAESPYDEFLTFETEMRRSGLHDESLFLEQVHSDGLKLLSMVRDQTVSASAV
ncbi:MAG: hypothetical protein Q8K89_05340, partial [Actinomycetota bacterium]|nr:hypothetical protein [Actinomycetota bacterium]